MKKITIYMEYAFILYKEMGNKTKAEYYQTELEKLNNTAVQ